MVYRGTRRDNGKAQKHVVEEVTQERVTNCIGLQTNQTQKWRFRMTGDSATRHGSNASLLGLTPPPSLAAVTRNALKTLFKVLRRARRSCGWMVLVLAAAIAGATDPK